MTRNAAYLASVLLAFSLVFPGGLAVAEEAEPALTALELQQEIETRQAAYAAARAEADAATEAIDANQARIEQLEKEIPEQRARSSKAARELYKFQQQSVGVIDLLLRADSFVGFLSELEYINKISDAHIVEMNRLAQIKEEISATQSELITARAEADARAEDARQAMQKAQEAQAEVQRRIEEEARLQAEAAAAAAALAESPRDNDKGSVAETSAEPAEEKAQKTAEKKAPDPDPDSDPEAEATEEPAAANKEAASEEAVGEVVAADPSSADWAARIDAYLAGSPLAGQGATFANAAAAYGVDPRLSPAISCVESGKGAVCFKPHNAWGWGSSSWKTWEEAIDAHVGGLARGYGGQLTKEGAKKYCPPNWKNWYSNVKAQMELI